MWQREFIDQTTYLNTQDTVYEVLSKTPEHKLCQNMDAVKIDLLLKQSQNAEPDAEFGVKLVPYRNVMSGAIIDPNAGGNYSRNVALAIAFIAADRDDWQRFIPVGLKARELSLKKKREEEILTKQNQPFKSSRSKRDDEEEFKIIDRDCDQDYDSSSDESTLSQNSTSSNADDQEEADDTCKIFDHATKQWRLPAPNEEFDFMQESLKTNYVKPEEDRELKERVAKVLQEQEQRVLQEQKTLSSDKIRRQVASLNDPLAQENVSEMTQRFRGAASSSFNLDQERQKVVERDCGVKSEKDTSGTSLLDRFAPEPENSKTVTAKAEPPVQPTTQAAPQYTLQQLMDFGSKTKPPPSVQRFLDQKNNVLPQKTTTTTTTTGLAAVAPDSKTIVDKISKISEKYKAICRKRIELATLELELDELLQ